MINAPAGFYDAVRAPSRTDRFRATLTLKNGTAIELQTKDFSNGSISLVRQCVSGEDLDFGSAMLAELDFKIYTSESWNSFYDAVVTPVFGVLSGESWLEVPLGVFRVAEAERSGTSVKMVAYDNVQALDKDYDGTAIQGTPFDVSTTICEICGLELALTEDEFEVFPNGEQPIQIDGETGCNTYRDCVKVVAQMMAAFVVADQDGKITFKRFSSDVTATLPASTRFSLTSADYICRYSAVTVKATNSTYTAVDTSAESGLEFVLETPPAWDNGTEETLQAMTDAVMEELKGLAYTPSTATIVGDPTIECGDRILYPTSEGDVSTLVTSVTWKFRGRCKLESKGSNPYLRTVQPQKTQIIRELEKQTYSNKLIFYSFTNQGVVDVSGSEIKELAKVTFVTTEATSAMFLAQLPVTVTVEDEVETAEVEHDVAVTDSTGATAEILDADGNPLTLKVVHSERTVKPGAVDLEIYYYMNGSQIDYELVDHLTAGKHILSLFYPFAELNGNQNNEFSVRLRCASGSVEIAKRALKATVTGQGLAATTAWDGTITIEEVVGRFGGKLQTGLRALSETVDVHTEIPTPATITEVVGRFGGRLRTGLRGFVEEITIAPIVEQQTIAPETEAMEWSFHERYVTMDDSGMKLQTVWSYESTESDIDEGRMTAVKAVVDDLASVESVEVK